jgi:hypothetical protein
VPILIPSTAPYSLIILSPTLYSLDSDSIINSNSFKKVSAVELYSVERDDDHEWCVDTDFEGVFLASFRVLSRYLPRG